MKGFENLASPVEYLEVVLGQLIPYQAVLEDLGFNLSLYLAVPQSANTGFLSERIALAGLRKSATKLLVFDPVQEELVEWVE